MKVAIIRYLHTRNPKGKPDDVDVARALKIGQGEAREVLKELLAEGRIVMIV